MSSFDRADYDTHLTDQAREAAPAQIKQLRMIERASLHAEHVTKDPHWDHYLSIVQSAIDRTRLHVEQWQDKLNDPSVVDPNDMMRIKMALVECKGRIAAWEAVLSLPREMLEQGERAVDLLQKIEPSDTTAA